MGLKKGVNLFFYLLIFWLLLTLNLNYLNIIVGIFVSFIVMLLSYPIIFSKEISPKPYYFIKILFYCLKLILHIYKSSIFYIINIISKDSRLTTIEVELNITNPLLISIIANSITLTPGTLTIDYVGNKLTVLALLNAKDSKEKLIQDIKNTYEKNLL